VGDSPLRTYGAVLYRTKRAGPQSPGARRTTYRCSLPGLAGFGNPHVARGFWAGSTSRCRRRCSSFS